MGHLKCLILLKYFFYGATAAGLPWPRQYLDITITFRHTTFGRISPDEWSARCRDLCLTTHNTHKRQTSMPSAGFEPAIPASHALDCDRHWKIYTVFCVTANVVSRQNVEMYRNDWYIYSEFINRSVKLSSLEKWLFLASVTCIHLKTVNALPPCGSYAGVHSETDGRIDIRKSAETIFKVLKTHLTITAFTVFFPEVYQNADFECNIKWTRCILKNRRGGGGGARLV